MQLMEIGSGKAMIANARIQAKVLHDYKKVREQCHFETLSQL